MRLGLCLVTTLVLALNWGCTSPVAVRGAQGEVTTSPEANGLVEAARDDLKNRLGAVDDPAVISVESVDWSDASLGCPEPEMMYAQVITPGYRIILELEDQQYAYHASRSRVIYCPSEGGGVPAQSVT